MEICLNTGIWDGGPEKWVTVPGGIKMAKAIYGRKVGMTQIFTAAGDCVAVTVVKVGPCTVVRKKLPKVKMAIMPSFSVLRMFVPANTTVKPFIK